MPDDLVRAALSHYLARYEEISLDEQGSIFDPAVLQLSAALGAVGVGADTYTGVIPSFDDSAAHPRITRLRRLFILARERLELALLCLADHMVELRLLNSSEESYAHAVAAETEAVYLPLTELFGMWKIRGELGELSLQILRPDVLSEIHRQQAAAAQLAAHDEICDHLLKEMKAARVSGSCKVHQGSAFSLYRRGQQTDQLTKLLRAVKIDVLVETEDECNQVSRLIDRRLLSSGQWVSKRRHFRDLISAPKFNGYQAILRKLDYLPTSRKPTSVSVEFRIRTREMEKVNTCGVLAAGLLTSERRAIRNAWWEDEESTQVVRDHLAGRPLRGVYVFSPVGEIHCGFPPGSTPIDYAYRIHTKVGDQCDGVLINGKESERDAVLENGDIVEILVNPSFRGPKETWLSFVKTSPARIHIARALAEREEVTFLGAYRKGRKAFERLLEAETRLYGLGPLSEDVIDRFLEKTARYEHHYPSLKAMFVDIADPNRSSKHRIPSLNRIVSLLIASQIAPHIVKADGSAVGVGEEWIRFAECTHKGRSCRVVPGTKIVGRLTRAGTQFQGLTVYRHDCENAPTGEEAIELEWRGEGRTEEAVRVTVEAIDDSKILLRVLDCIYELYSKGVYLHHLEARVSEDWFAHISMKITRQREAASSDSEDGIGLLHRLEESLKRLEEKRIISKYSVQPLSPVEKVLLARRDKLPNPYTPQPLRDARLFKGREEEKERAITSLLDGRNPLIVYGDRRVGKTSFLRYLKDHSLPEDAFTPVLVEYSDFSEVGFWQKIAVEINKAMKSPNQSHPGAVPYDWGLLQELKSTPFDAFRKGLEKARERLGSKRLVIMVDEFTALDTDWPDEAESKRVISQIKVLIENYGYLEFVLSVHDELFRAAAEQRVNSLPLLAEGIPLFLSDCLDRESAKRLILEPLGGIVQYEPQAVDEILDLTAGQPYYIHSILYEVITMVSREAEPRVTPRHVAHAVERILEGGGALFHHLTRHINDAERATVRAVATLSKSAPSRRVSLAEVGEFLRDKGRSGGNLAQELARLSEIGILNRKREGRVVGYELRIPLFGRWLTRDIMSLASEAQ
ncbi:MAG TPA: TGS domain-containing protein [Pyrinomonadaceae bacterium]